MNEPDDPFPSEDNYNFLSEHFAEESEFKDCFLDAHDLEQLLSPGMEKWKDLTSDTHPAVFTIDHSKEEQWKIAKKEIENTRKRMKIVFGSDDEELSEVHETDIVSNCLGLSSAVGLYFKRELSLTDEQYLKFMCTFCLQSAYRVSSAELFRNNSILKEFVPMPSDEYNGIWQKIASIKEVPCTHIRRPQSEDPLWTELEDIVNTLCGEFSIKGSAAGRRISIALDDDKIWFASKVCTQIFINLSFIFINLSFIFAHIDDFYFKRECKRLIPLISNLRRM